MSYNKLALVPALLCATAAFGQGAPKAALPQKTRSQAVTATL